MPSLLKKPLWCVGNDTFDDNELNQLHKIRKTYLFPKLYYWRSKAVPLLSSCLFSVCLCSYHCCRWVNALGMAAAQGIDVVLRHSFFDYGYTHLVDQNFNPLPVSLSISVQQELERQLVSIVTASVALVFLTTTRI